MSRNILLMSILENCLQIFTKKWTLYIHHSTAYNRKTGKSKCQ